MKQMCAAISRSESLAGNAEGRCWSDGRARVAFRSADGESRLADLYQSDPCRVLFPRPGSGAPLEAVIVTTSGGIVGGDRIRIELEAGVDSVATVTTQAAEKIYRSTGTEARIDIDLFLEKGAILEWMPQETILFNDARLRRVTRIDMSSHSRLLAGEMIVFGRRAHGEEFRRGLLHDSWRLRIDRRLAWADALHLADDAGKVIERATAFGGAPALATMLYRGDDAPDQLSVARDLASVAESTGCTAGVSCVDTILILRFLGPDAASVRRAQSEIWSSFRASVLGFPQQLPRVWET